MAKHARVRPHGHGSVNPPDLGGVAATQHTARPMKMQANIDRLIRPAAARAALAVAAGLSSAPATADIVDLVTVSGHSLSASVSGYHYDEPAVMSLKGAKLGLAYAGTYAFGGSWPRSAEVWFLRGGLRFATGKVDYRSPSSGDLDDKPDWYVEAAGVIGRDFGMDGYVLAPHVGIGLRHLVNDLRGVSSTGDLGYRRTSRYVFLPVGLTHKVSLPDGSQLHSTVEYAHLIRGAQKVAWSDTSPTRSDVRLRQRDGYGVKLSIRQQMSTWSWGPTLTHWHVAQSDPGGTPAFVEPRNKTYELGFQLDYRF